MALSGAFWEGFVADLDSQKQLMTIAHAHLYHRRKRGKRGRGTPGCDLPNRDGIDVRRTGAVRWALAPFKTLAESLGAAVVLVSHATSGVFKAGNTAGFSKNQITRAWCRINAVATREGFGAVRKMELATWRPRNHPLIAFKDAKGIKDCRAVARAIFASFPRSMCAGPIDREDSRFDCTKRIFDADDLPEVRPAQFSPQCGDNHLVGEGRGESNHIVKVSAVEPSPILHGQL